MNSILKIEDINYNKLLNREPIIVDNIKTYEYLKKFLLVVDAVQLEAKLSNNYYI
jgi:hypothetical protein